LAYLLNKDKRLYVPLSKFLLQPEAYNDGSGGVLRDLIHAIDATISGGSTQSGDAKFRDDFQKYWTGRLARGLRVAPATTNLLAGLPAGKQNTSFEVDDTVGDWVGSADVFELSHNSADGVHGSCCLQADTDGSNDFAGANANVSAVTTGSTAYTFYTRVKAGIAQTVGQEVEMGIRDGVSYTWGSHVVLSQEWQFAQVTRTLDAGENLILVYIRYAGTDVANGDVLLIDNAQLTETAGPLPFVEEGGLAVDAYFANADIGLSAGDGVSGVIILQHNWPGDDGGIHYLLDCRADANNGWALYKSGMNRIYINTVKAGSAKSKWIATNSTNMPAGGISLITFSIDEDNNQQLFLNGVEGTNIAGTGDRETSINANFYFGKYFSGGYEAGGNMLLFLHRRAFTGREHIAIWRRFYRAFLN